jgi:hypothetical protein
MRNQAKHNRWIIFSVAFLILLTSLSCQLVDTPSLRFIPDSMPKAQVGVFYYVTIKITNNQTPAGGFSITQGNLPKGLRLKRITGADAVLISGVPQESGAFHFVIDVWCYGTNHSGQTGTKDYVLPVSPP